MAERPRILKPVEPERGVSRWRPRGTPAGVEALSLTLLAAAVFVLAFRNGTYDMTSRGALAIAVWWLVVLAVVGGFVSVARLPLPALLAGSALAGLAALAGISLIWAPSAENALSALGIDVLYVGVFLFVALLARPRSLEAWCDGIALGISLIVAIALLSRLFPNLLGSNVQFEFLPAAQTRLSYPVGYWNGLAVFAALAVPLLLRAATAPAGVVRRAVALVPFPALGAVLYLTSSRGGVLAAAIGGFAFVLLTSQRVAAAVALAVGGAGAGAAGVILAGRNQLVNGPLGAAATSQGRSAFLPILALCLGGAVLYALLATRLRRFSDPVERGALAAVVLVAVAAVIAAHPVARFHQFTQPLALAGASSNYVNEHLFSGSGNGRWEMWSSAVREFRAHPLLGDGAGAFQSWWEQHRSIPLFVKNAHSLYLETLGELGLVGLALVVLFVLTGLVTGVRRALTGSTALRGSVAALTAAFAAYCLGAGVDWLWQIPAVTAVGIALLALATGAAAEHETSRRPQHGRVTVVAVRLAVLVVGLAAVAVEFVPLIGNIQLEQSQAAARRGDNVSALHAAAAARDLQPWASTPYLQLALVEESSGSLPAAHSDIAAAIRRDSRNWSLWLVTAQIESKQGAIGQARASLTKARRLNPLWARGAAQR